AALYVGEISEHLTLPNEKRWGCWHTTFGRAPLIYLLVRPGSVTSFTYSRSFWLCPLYPPKADIGRQATACPLCAISGRPGYFSTSSIKECLSPASRIAEKSRNMTSFADRSASTFCVLYLR